MEQSYKLRAAKLSWVAPLDHFNLRARCSSERTQDYGCTARLQSEIVNDRANFDQLPACGQEERAYFTVRSLSVDVDTLLGAASEATHGHVTREDSVANLLGALPAEQKSNWGADDVVSLLAALPAGHGSDKRADDVVDNSLLWI
ncbi:hypothetical protein ACMFMG_004274 [Clarireedia jacksonii]